jgi:hypothetical protein
MTQQTIKDQFHAVRRYGDIAEICRRTLLTRATVERWEAGNNVTAKTESLILKAISSMVKERAQ